MPETYSKVTVRLDAKYCSIGITYNCPIRGVPGLCPSGLNGGRESDETGQLRTAECLKLYPPTIPCPDCEGKGRHKVRRELRERGSDMIQMYPIPDASMGSIATTADVYAVQVYQDCEACHGTGRVPKPAEG